ncbi:3-hexulose-6-phosphate isomerase [Artemisia annua]|uniref:3-hexulose-6-phosphate isomerase n=1 Tax=Artemisia annua TaxID=35608 RepID=A0A2U1Q7B5_ARTAN|nr:3-hexulose-6-phosphate isomerase [Artemisia annua]
MPTITKSKSMCFVVNKPRMTRSQQSRVDLPETGSCVKYADVVVYVAAHTMANDGMEGGGLLLLPMVVCMKVHCLCCLRWLFISLASILGQDADVVRPRHTNLE